ncbi:MAG TPA: hypothetical protein VHG08_03415 [Longimicrobium sp.]|nr:hypothetical protein [Longimicrobium sp.]
MTDPDDRNGPDPLDRRIDAAAGSYHEPPAAPRLDAVWARMEGDVAAALRAAPAQDELAQRRARRLPQWAAAAAALAASFVIGLVAGRSTREPASPSAPLAEATQPAPPPAAPSGTPAPPVYQRAAGRHFAEARDRLATLHGELREGRVPADVETWSREMLAETRILLAGPAGADPLSGTLLRELETLLAEIAALDGGAAEVDAALTRGTLEQTRVIERLRSAGGAT